MKKFEFDNFQKQAMDFIDQENSVVVSAPTGSGKTVLAEYVIEKCIREGQGVVYTSPIKALSNQKYRDFRELFKDKVGIITGDVSINPNADLLIMTTEIFRNALFDESERFINMSWVIFDEIHYIDDFERGTVWEEALMFFPEHMKMLCLSATIPNLTDFVSWIEKIHKFPVKKVVEKVRAVPLKHSFSFSGQIIDDLSKLKKSYSQSYKRSQFDTFMEDNTFKLLKHIRDTEGFPCVFFVFARRRCEEYAKIVSKLNIISEEEREKLVRLWYDLIKKFNLENERSALALEPLVARGIAYHHAGMLPSLKEVVERLFTSRLIKLIFTTETFALGINMPAKTVVLDELRKFYGLKFDNMKTRDYFQMAGRAGRRGMDECGFVYSRINPFRIGYDEVHRVVSGTPEEVNSQFNTSYATLLHLYNKFKENLYDVYLSSLHYHQSGKSRQQEARQQLRNKIHLLKELGFISNNELSTKGRFASQIFGYEMALGELFELGLLEELNEMNTIIVLSALVYEPRKGTIGPVLTKNIKHLRKEIGKVTRNVFKIECNLGITPVIKKPYFHMAPIVEAWAHGKSFSAIQDLSDIDEGTIVRYMRMIIQLLRELKHSSFVSKNASKKFDRCLFMINRDIIDAEKQLQV